MELETATPIEQCNDCDFSPRPYQVVLLENAVERNLIVYLRTGSGKTFIAVMLIRRLSDDILRPYPSDPEAKRSIFLANTVPLVKQQANYLAKFTPFKVAEYYGDKKIDGKVVDLWNHKVWQSEIAINQILVMTPQILDDCLAKDFISLERVNLIIFDECHHATGKHPYSRLVDKYQCFEGKERIRLLGMTASIVNKKCDLSSFNRGVAQLEAKFKCQVETTSIMFENDEIDSSLAAKAVNLHKPKIVKLIFENTFERGLEIFETMKKLRQNMNDLSEQLESSVKANIDLQESLEEMGTFETLPILTNDINPYKLFKNELADVESLLNDLGLWSFRVGFGKLVRLAQKLATLEGLSNSAMWKMLANEFEKLKSELIDKLVPGNQEEKTSSKILAYSSEKVRGLVDYLREHVKSKKDFHTIVFVQRKSTAVHLNNILNSLNDSLDFIKSDYIHGDNRTSSIGSKQQQEALNKFRTGQINILIATNIVEEGIDVPACNMVVRFDRIFNFGSFVQSKGRARYKNSTFIVMIDSNDLRDAENDLNNFIQIEEDMERKYFANRSEIEPLNSEDEVAELKKRIPSLVRGKCEIDCFDAIAMINKYCAQMEHDICGPLYPNYREKEETSGAIKLYQYSLRLPPNPVFEEKLLSDWFKRKKWAKMDVAMKMCRELDKRDEFAPNLTILKKDDWIKAHCDLKENEHDELTNKKIGSTKNKREYPFKFADELVQSWPQAGQSSFLFELAIEESVLEKSRGAFKPLINDKFRMGFLSAKYFEAAPEFNLYKRNSQFSVRVRCVRGGIELSEEQIERLQNFNLFIFGEILRVDPSTVDFENNPCGGYLVILKDGSVDWEKISASAEGLTVYEMIKQGDQVDHQLVGSMAKLTYKVGGLMRIEEVCRDLNPSKEFPNKDRGTYADHFLKEYSVATSDLQQPMIQAQHVDSIGFNFLLKSGQPKTKGDKKKSIIRHFVAEHLKVIPFEESQLWVMFMLPNIFHRLNCLLKVCRFQIMIENHIASDQRLNLTSIKYQSLDWEKSIKFNKSNKNEPSEVLEENSSESGNEFYMVPDKMRNKQSIEIELDSPPPLIFQDENSRLANPNFPNVYHLLQCFTLKTAFDAFDLERYEILGDCFLKLAVVMKIYSEFPRTQEGKMVKLKSMRVSNRYLFDLAHKKNLHELIVALNCTNEKEKNCFGPWTRSASNLMIPDKSMADCVEALIGCYLIHLGTQAAKAFIEWLGYVVSDSKGQAKFVGEKFELSGPQVSDEFTSKLVNKFSDFEASLGYEFNNKAYLYQAFTHASDMNNTQTPSYQKLELVGDAVLDMLITQYIFSDSKEHSPGELTDLRQALVNNNFFGTLAVKHSFHKFLSYSSPGVDKSLTNYVRNFETHSPLSAFLQDSETSEVDDVEFEFEPPKFLADIFESVAGAIYLDSGCSLQAVWSSYYKFFKPFLETFKQNLPQSPVKLLNHLKPNSKPKIESNTVKEDGMEYCQAVLLVDGQEFIGKGESSSAAKKGAYKKAVRAFKHPETPNYIFF